MGLKNKLSRMLFSRKESGPPARQARNWSNGEIRLLGRAVAGSVINVSAWRDEDKQGGYYKDYFPSAQNYSVSNYQGWRGIDKNEVPPHFEGNHYELDLRTPAPVTLAGRFDLVFNHTTLEHVFDAHQAMRTMAALSRDAMLVVVPFIQHLHGPVDGDFWRFSPYCMRRLFQMVDMEIVYESAGPKTSDVRYLTYFAARDASKWISMQPESPGDAEAVLRAPTRG